MVSALKGVKEDMEKIKEIVENSDHEDKTRLIKTLNDQLKVVDMLQTKNMV